MEFGDHIIGINDEHVDDRIHFHRLIRFLAAQKKHQRMAVVDCRKELGVELSSTRGDEHYTICPRGPIKMRWQSSQSSLIFE
ncbi:hypothetical protein KIN20_016762 [Parelaphostrongylus tenuis]|uniref:PDZ domain-containing protein n=1 Tax=Parelaphostrongylus tenuis TaxID=148309 RepID=A0AAD5MEL4_PARTN|nr:hypothetical protein KIN20_001031 [Parelaphostrongylus tenuis]KAJ1358350.1 hypothetical protein KIN20_016762 [Parelaphostrongylus tenuis]